MVAIGRVSAWVVVSAVGLSASSSLADDFVVFGAKATTEADITSVYLKRNTAISFVKQSELQRAIPGWKVNNHATYEGKKGYIRLYDSTGGDNRLVPGIDYRVPIRDVSNSERPAYVAAFDYQNSKGEEQYGGVCADPVSYTVIDGGAGGTSYLGYDIPAGEYGYFYQMWNYEDFADGTDQLFISLGEGSGAYNFQVLDNSFRHLATDDAFDLQEIGLPFLHDTHESYQMQHYMAEEDALGTGGVSTMWGFDEATGIATMSFPDGMWGGETGSIVGYTSPFEPRLTIDANVSATFLGDYTCEDDWTMVPSPAPGTLGVLIPLGWVLTKRRRK